MRITAAEVLVTSPGRNFVTLRISTDEGLVGLGDATLNGRELAVASYLSDHVVPLLAGRDPQRMQHSPATNEVFHSEVRFERGLLLPADVPGLGVGYDDEAARAHPYDPAYLPVNRLLDGTMHDW